MCSLRIYFPPQSKYIVRADDEQVGLSIARTRQDRIMEHFCLFNEAYSIPIRFSIRSDFNAGPFYIHKWTNFLSTNCQCQ